MLRDTAANRLTFKGFTAPLSSGQTDERSVRCSCWHLVAKMAFYCGFSFRQLVASAVKLAAVTVAKSVDGEAINWLVGTSNCRKNLELVTRRWGKDSKPSNCGTLIG